MTTLSAKDKGVILIPTGKSDYPFLIRLEELSAHDTDTLFILVRADGTLSGDGCSYDLPKYFPDLDRAKYGISE